MFFSPLEQFEITPLKGLFYLFDFLGLSVTNFTISAVFVVFVVSLFSVLCVFDAKFLASPGQYFLEFLYGFVYGLFISNLSEEEHQYFPYVFALFLSLLSYNLLGLFPYGFTITSQIVVAAFFSFSTFLGLLWLGVSRHKLNFIGIFFPPEAPSLLAFLLVPIEIVSFFSRPFSLAIRLFANMTAGHVLLKILAGFAGVLFSSIVTLSFDLMPIINFLSIGPNIMIDFNYPSAVSYHLTVSVLCFDYVCYNFNLFLTNIMYYYSNLFYIEDLLENAAGKKSFWIQLNWRLLSRLGYLSPTVAFPTARIFYFSLDLVNVLIPTTTRADVLATIHPRTIYYIYEALVFFNSVAVINCVIPSVIFSPFFVVDITWIITVGNFALWCVTSFVALLLPIALLGFFIVLELFVSVLQAYVFTILVVIYLRDVIELH